jgi:hypothetical protein
VLPKSTQEAVYSCFLREQWTERFFEKVHRLLEKHATFLISVKDGEFSPNLENTEFPLLIIELLRLFCENHYTELQEYLRYQTNSKTQYNLVDGVCKLLSGSKVSPSTEQTIEKIFDTLTEFSQGPCLGNQVHIATSGYLEYAASLLRTDARKGGDTILKEKTLNIQSRQFSQLTAGVKELSNEKVSLVLI